MGFFIVFEGLNGAGKTTLAKMLASDLNGVYLSTPADELKIIREIVDHKLSLQTRFFYYLFSVLYASEEIKELRKEKIVVCDRYLHSTLSIHQLMGVNVNLVDIKSLGLEQPDISFFIYTSNEAERLERIIARGKNTKYDKMTMDPEFRTVYIKYFQELGEFIFIDTSHESEQQSLEKIKKEILRRENGLNVKIHL